MCANMTVVSKIPINTELIKSQSIVKKLVCS